MKKVPSHSAEESLKIRLAKTQARFKRVRNPEGRDGGVGEFFMLLDVTAVANDIYIPTSIASGKKPTGFVYQIEGTDKGELATASISAEGRGSTQLTLGTIVYTKIPKGKTATFRILVSMRGAVQETYSIVINRINFKHNPSDARYEKMPVDIHSKTLSFT